MYFLAKKINKKKKDSFLSRIAEQVFIGIKNEAVGSNQTLKVDDSEQKQNIIILQNNLYVTEK